MNKIPTKRALMPQNGGQRVPNVAKIVPRRAPNAAKVAPSIVKEAPSAAKVAPSAAKVAPSVAKVMPNAPQTAAKEEVVTSEGNSMTAQVQPQNNIVPPDVDPDFNIADHLKVLPKHMKPHIAKGNHIYNSSGVVLICENGHKLFYNYPEIKADMKCKTCNCKRPEKSVLTVAEALFKSTFVLHAPKILICKEHNLNIILASEYKCVIPQNQNQNITNTDVKLPKKPIVVYLPPPYRQAEITNALKKFLRENRGQFTGRLQKIANKQVRYRLIKDPPPKTKNMMLVRGASNMQIGFDPDVLPDSEAKLLCLENCYWS
jgi:hypothetical protein